MKKIKKKSKIEYLDDFNDDTPNESEAVALALVLLDSKWDGDDDFAKGMRLLQNKLGLKGKGDLSKLA